MTANLTTKTVSGIFWNGIQKFSTLGIQLLITIIIARILSPEDYGLIGMLAIFTSLGAILLDSGFGQALIRKQNVTVEDYSSVFYSQIFLGLIIYAILYSLSAQIASFFNTPRLENISKVIFLIFPINSIGLVHTTIMRKELKFRQFAKITILSSIASGITAVVLAYSGFGVWTLVIQMLSQSLFLSVFIWVIIKWRPSFCFNIRTIIEIAPFGLSLLGIGVIKTITRNIYTLIIGKFYPLSEVGYYNQAKRFEEIPTHSITGIIQSVSYPVLSIKQSDDAKLKSGYRKIITQTMFIITPLMLILLAAADNLFLVLLTEKWVPAVPYFRLLCVIGVLYPLHSINENILKVKGKGKKLIVLEILKNILLFVSILITLKISITALLVGSIVTSFISIIINMHYCGIEIKYSILDQLKDITPIAVISLLASVFTWSLSLIDLNLHLLLFLQLLTGTTVFLLISFLFKLESLSLMKDILTARFKK
jgi:teichuronic acid exporter